jgi:hypothetical protein
MTTKVTSEVGTIHRLLFRALLEMRSQGLAHKDTVVFQLADLFQQVVLEMENAAKGRGTYEGVLKLLGERARATGLGEWLDRHLEDLNP